MFDAIRGDAEIIGALKQHEMAFALHEVIMRSPKWALVYNSHRTEFVPRYAAHFVAALRSNGEYYNDYYGRTPEGMTEEHVRVMRGHLLRLGITGMKSER